jgi:hypothetical protein
MATANMPQRSAERRVGMKEGVTIRRILLSYAPSQSHLLACLLPAIASAQTFSVSPCTDSGAQHERQAMKTRKAPATRNAATIPDVSVREMVRWPAPKNPSVSTSPLNARERQIVTVTGWLRLTKISDDDCDIHIQLGADPKKHFPQVIAEIPPGSKTLHPQSAQALAAKLTKSTKFVDGARAVKITVTWFAFFDASNVCADHRKRVRAPQRREYSVGGA